MISIIVPVYNNSLLLDECIQSVVSQTYYDWELILVDDGSTDGSGDICDCWTKKEDRIRTIHQMNAGVSAARNRGILESKGDFLMFLDSDDALHKETCFCLINYQNDSHADCIVFGSKQVSGNLWIPEEEITYDSLADFKKDFEKILLSELLSPVWNKFYKRELIKSHFPKDMSFGEDLVFCLNYLKQCEKICFVPWPYYLHNNLNEQSLTHTFRKSQINDIERWQSAILQFMGKGNECRSLYNKYVKDVILWLKRFYASDEMGRKEKKSFLKQWYRNSHLKSVKPECILSVVDRFILSCLRWNLWLLPGTLLSVKYRMRQRV